MYTLAASEKSNALAEGSHEHLLCSVFQEWHQCCSSSSSSSSIVSSALLSRLQAEHITAMVASPISFPSSSSSFSNTHPSAAAEPRDGRGFLLRCIQEGTRHHRHGWFSLAGGCGGGHELGCILSPVDV